MTIDEALNIVLNDLNAMLIPASESERITRIKSNIKEIISASCHYKKVDNHIEKGISCAD